jgi:hypothetical protein
MPSIQLPKILASLGLRTLHSLATAIGDRGLSVVSAMLRGCADTCFLGQPWDKYVLADHILILTFRLLVPNHWMNHNILFLNFAVEVRQYLDSKSHTNLQWIQTAFVINCTRGVGIKIRENICDYSMKTHRSSGRFCRCFSWTEAALPIAWCWKFQSRQ